MPVKWEIGEEAKELNGKTILERMKIPMHSIRKIVGALILYFLTMVLFYIFI